ncbi:hypothetical protein GCM10022286_23000 [Gryllotalpicola daejeonensis]|uniref:Uncharacterized protein n=1 Tax=Gryllotalpicola daejeonensis TaxID=993087 RepID=A0ABP7ZLI0_9MICO
MSTDTSQASRRARVGGVPGVEILWHTRRLVINAIVFGFVYALPLTATRGTADVTLTLHPSPFVFLALAAVFFASVSWVIRSAPDEAAAIRVLRRASRVVVTIALGSLVIALVWFFTTPITGWPFENSWIAPFPFGTVTVDVSSVQ